MHEKQYQCNECYEIFSASEIDYDLFCSDCGGHLELYEENNQDEEGISNDVPKEKEAPVMTFDDRAPCYNCNELTDCTFLNKKITKTISTSSEAYGAMVKTTTEYIAANVSAFCCAGCLNKRKKVSLLCNLLTLISFISVYSIMFIGMKINLDQIGMIFAVLFSGFFFGGIVGFILTYLCNPILKGIFAVKSIKCKPGYKFSNSEWIDDHKG